MKMTFLKVSSEAISFIKIMLDIPQKKIKDIFS